MRFGVACYTMQVLLGIISDVHANLPALEAVYASLQDKGAELVLCLGDLVGYGPHPNEVVAFIRQHDILCTLGAADEQIAYEFASSKERREGVADTTLEWTRTVIDAANVEFLRQLPVQQRLHTPAGRMRFFHGSLDSPSQGLELQQDIAGLNRLLEQARCDILACGKTHVPFQRQLPRGWIINPGSVGLSLNGEPGADYALVRLDQGRVDIHMDKVEYDFAAVAFDIVAWGLPATIAEAVQRGKMP